MTAKQRLILFLLIIGLALTYPIWKEFDFAKFNNDQKLLGALITAALGSAFGAWGGAYAVEQKQQNKILTEELRASQVASVLVFNIMSTLKMLISNEIKVLQNDYEELKRLNDARRKLKNPPNLTPCFRIFSALDTETDTLSDLLHHKISLLPKGVAAFAKLEMYLKQLRGCSVRRTEIIESLRKQDEESTLTSQRIEAVILGITTTGRPDNIYGDLLRAMDQYSQHCLFYANILFKELQERARIVAPQIKYSGSLDLCLLSKDIKKLIPKEKDYQHFLKQFPS